MALICRQSSVLAVLLSASLIAWSAQSTSTFSHASTPAGQVNDISIFVLIITGLIFAGVSGLLIYVLVTLRVAPAIRPSRRRCSAACRSNWRGPSFRSCIIMVLFLGTARVIFAIQDAPKPANALDVIVVGHQFWWEFRYPQVQRGDGE